MPRHRSRSFRSKKRSYRRKSKSARRRSRRSCKPRCSPCVKPCAKRCPDVDPCLTKQEELSVRAAYALLHVLDSTSTSDTSAPSAPPRESGRAEPPEFNVSDRLNKLLENTINALSDKSKRNAFAERFREIQRVVRNDFAFYVDKIPPQKQLAREVIVALYEELPTAGRDSRIPRNIQDVSEVDLTRDDATNILEYYGEDAVSRLRPMAGGYSMRGGSCSRYY